MTPPGAPGKSVATRPPLLPMLLLYLVPLIAALATPASDFLGSQGDISLYLEKARGVAGGLVPYRDIPIEYPPLALVPMVVPYLLWPFGSPQLDVYAWLFAGEQAILLVALALALGRIVGLGGAWGLGPTDVARAQRVVAWRLVLLAAGASLAITWRFDLFPTVLVTVAIWAALENRPLAAGIAVGAGMLAKLFPLVVAPALAVAWLAPLDRSRLFRFGEAALVAVVVGMAPFVLLAGTDALIFVAYQAERGLQIESIGGGFVLLDALVRGETPIRLISPFSAHEVTGALGRVVLSATSVLTIVGFGAVAWLGWRRIKRDVDRHDGVLPGTIVVFATASILVLLVTSKVLSIQYIVWLVPFAALLPKWQFRLAAVTVGLTMPIHPLLYDDLVAQEALPILVLNLRNALLVALLGWVLWKLARPAGLEPTTFRSAT